MKQLALAIPLLILYGCGGGSTSISSQSEETVSTDLFEPASLAETTLDNVSQLYLPLKYLENAHSNFKDITSDSQTDLTISFNNNLVTTPIKKNKIICQNGGWKQHQITSVDYNKKHISGLTQYNHCKDRVHIHGTKKIEYTLNDQNQLSYYSESYLSNFSIADVIYVAGSQINYNNFHYTNHVVDKYTMTSTLKINVNESSKEYILGFKDLAVAYSIANNTLTFKPTKGKIYIKDASAYFEVNPTQNVDFSPIKITQHKYLTSGNITFLGYSDKSFSIQSKKQNILSFITTNNQEQMDLSW